MKLLAFSDLHLHDTAPDAILSAAQAADLVIGAGDFTQGHEGLEAYMARLEPIAERAIYVPGNHESLEALRAATSATVLHGEIARRDSLTIGGIGGGIPPIPPKPWESWDLTEEQAEEAAAGITDKLDLLILHSPPVGLGDHHSELGRMGSTALKRLLQERPPRLCLFGHVHDCWGMSGRLGPTEWRNLGPEPVWFTL